MYLPNPMSKRREGAHISVLCVCREYVTGLYVCMLTGHLRFWTSTSVYMSVRAFSLQSRHFHVSLLHEGLGVHCISAASSSSQPGSQPLSSVRDAERDMKKEGRSSVSVSASGKNQHQSPRVMKAVRAVRVCIRGQQASHVTDVLGSVIGIADRGG